MNTLWLAFGTRMHTLWPALVTRWHTLWPAVGGRRQTWLGFGSLMNTLWPAVGTWWQTLWLAFGAWMHTLWPAFGSRCHTSWLAACRGWPAADVACLRQPDEHIVACLALGTQPDARLGHTLWLALGTRVTHWMWAA